jgi:hypothetical protein
MVGQGPSAWRAVLLAGPQSLGPGRLAAAGQYTFQKIEQVLGLPALVELVPFIWQDSQSRMVPPGDRDYTQAAPEQLHLACMQLAGMAAEAEGPQALVRTYGRALAHQLKVGDDAGAGPLLRLHCAAACA